MANNNIKIKTTNNENEEVIKMYKMYDFKTNKETKKLELVHVDFNAHPSLVGDGKVQFESAFAYEFARHEYAKYVVKTENESETSDDVDKMNLLENEFGFTFSTFERTTGTILTNVPDELIGLLTVTLYAHGILYGGIQSKVDEKTSKTVYSLVTPKISLGMTSFFNDCRNTIANIKSNELTLEEGIKIIKPLYNDCTALINHEAVTGICKKWVESTKEKNTRSFVMGLLPKYKLTKTNRIDSQSPLRNRASFEKYLAMWLVTGGQMIDKKSKNNDAVTMSSIIANAKNKNK